MYADVDCSPRSFQEYLFVYNTIGMITCHLFMVYIFINHFINCFKIYFLSVILGDVIWICIILKYSIFQYNLSFIFPICACVY